MYSYCTVYTERKKIDMTEAEPILNDNKNDSTFRKIKSTEKQNKRRQ